MLPNLRAAFTLLELLVVIVIIGLLATIGLPAIRGMTKSNAIIAANRQMLDDISAARQSAIANHTTVYMVFVPSGVQNIPLDKLIGQTDILRQYTNLYGGQFTTYALLSLRSVGDQPGQTSPKYLTDWRSLPNGVFIATNKFPPTTSKTYSSNVVNFYTNVFAYGMLFPFPIVSTNASSATKQNLPYIGFNYLGQLVNGIDEAIPLARGSIFYLRDGNGNFIQGDPDVKETPPGNSISVSNVIHIDWLTGRAHVERLEVQ
jgi:prepilin-type N-terminal cleavage/methylation domain-containing protein